MAASKTTTTSEQGTGPRVSNERPVPEETKDSVKRTLFASDTLLPDEVSQEANDTWVKDTLGKDLDDRGGLIKLRGEGRTASVVRGEMNLVALGMKSATAFLEAAVAAAGAPLLVEPEETQAALDTFVKEKLGKELDDREGLIKLRGEGRTSEVIAAELALVRAGVNAALAKTVVASLPEEVSQEANDTWVKDTLGKDLDDRGGLIKLRGEGRTADVVRGEMKLVALGVKVAQAAAAAASAAAAKEFLAEPEQTQAALDEWVKEKLGKELDDREGLIKLRGEGRTSEVIAAELALVRAGAKAVLVKPGVKQEGA